MSDRINGVKAGTGIRASWGNDIVDQIRRLHLIPGNGIKISTTSKGTRIELDLPQEQASGGASITGACIPVFLYAFSSGGAYKGATFALPGSNSTSYVTDPEGNRMDHVYFPHVCPSTALPVGCTVLACMVDSESVPSSED